MRIAGQIVDKAMRVPEQDRSVSSRQGVVLVILLWVLAIVSLVTLSFSKSIRVEFNAARNNKDLIAAHYLARAGMAEAAYRMIRKQMVPQVITPEGPLRPPDDLDMGKVIAEFPEGRVTTQIMDESGKISLNFANDEMLRRLLAAISIPKEDADTIVDSIFDWMDPDPNHRLSGAEDDYYQTLNPPYRAKNAAFDTLEELLLVKGVTPELFYGTKEKNELDQIVYRFGLSRYLTVYSFSSQININAAALPVLLSVPDLDPSAAQVLYERRLVKPFINMQEVTQMVPVALGRAMQWLRVGVSLSYSLESEAELAGSRIRKTLRCVIVIDPMEREGFRTVYWNEMIR